jgi:hypothetical protein
VGLVSQGDGALHSWVLGGWQECLAVGQHGPTSVQQLRRCCILLAAEHSLHSSGGQQGLW